ncbi:MAG: muramoyltetrapeptide carboxypeptidase LdcA involved in peptidoglycan recycling [Candidatus Saccharimonadales bacterium]|jgi:muramoyltetrapeptide carboxypeptidase LdcA involved in peptidoglycan recycling
MKEFVKLSKLKKGDQVAIISPSSGLAGIFPWIQDLGYERIEKQFGLKIKEYPTTRQMGSSLEDRARDVMDAFADPQNKAVISSIGGDDQIKLIKHLDPAVFTGNPKPFFGFSDNMHLHNFLWGLGIPSYYGGAVMNQFAMQGQMMDLTADFIGHALFDEGEFELVSPTEYNDIGIAWDDKTRLDETRQMEPNEGFFWDGTNDAEGILWGGCVESLVAQSATGKYLPSNDDLEGTVLYLETAEDIPEHWIIEYLLTGFGERGWLDKFKAVIIGRPKAWEFNNQNDAATKIKFREEQRKTVVETIRQYNKTIPIVQNLDFGHTDPQVPLPSGGRIRISASTKQIFLNY